MQPVAGSGVTGNLNRRCIQRHGELRWYEKDTAQGKGAEDYGCNRAASQVHQDWLVGTGGERDVTFLAGRIHSRLTKNALRVGLHSPPGLVQKFSSRRARTLGGLVLSGCGKAQKS